MTHLQIYYFGLHTVFLAKTFIGSCIEDMFTTRQLENIESINSVIPRNKPN